MDKGLSLRNVVISKGSQRLLEINREVPPGSVLTVMGPSGSGKSTLLSFIIGQLASDFRAAGEVWLDGARIDTLTPEKRRVGILFQDVLLFPHMSVGSNLSFGLRMKGSRTERRSRVEQALEEIGLAGFYDRDPATLSGGQKTRVALMRMLLSEPCALLLDEPFSRLDAELRRSVRSLVFDVAKARDLPVLMVTHDEADAEAAGGDVFRLD